MNRSERILKSESARLRRAKIRDIVNKKISTYIQNCIDFELKEKNKKLRFKIIYLFYFTNTS